MTKRKVLVQICTVYHRRSPGPWRRLSRGTERLGPEAPFVEDPGAIRSVNIMQIMLKYGCGMLWYSLPHLVWLSDSRLCQSILWRLLHRLYIPMRSGKLQSWIYLLLFIVRPFVGGSCELTRVRNPRLSHPLPDKLCSQGPLSLKKHQRSLLLWVGTPSETIPCHGRPQSFLFLHSFWKRETGVMFVCLYLFVPLFLCIDTIPLHTIQKAVQCVALMFWRKDHSFIFIEWDSPIWKGLIG